MNLQDMTPDQLVNEVAQCLRVMAEPDTSAALFTKADAQDRLAKIRGLGVLNLTQMRMAQRLSRRPTRK